MDSSNPDQKDVPQGLRKQLALAVRSIQWSYAIFWTISPAHSGGLEWHDGYYNGEIKTRKTVQSAETNTDKLGLHRTDQLRELFESLSPGETNSQAKRPTAALIPEDLSNAEWYFLVCMSFKFDIGEGLAGRAIAMNEAIWLCNVHLADTGFFSRALLAKSAGIQTVVCFPHFGGVVEMGTSELVQEDLNLIHHVKLMFLDRNTDLDSITNDHIAPYQDNMRRDGLDHLLDSPHNCSEDLADNPVRDKSNVVDGVEGETTSQVMNWRQFMDDAMSNCLNNSLNCSDCVSQTYEDPGTAATQREAEEGKIDGTQECNQNDLEETDMHYHSVLSSLLKTSHQLILGPYFGNGNRESSFVSWIRDGSVATQVHKGAAASSQMLLKKVLTEVPRLHLRCCSEEEEEAKRSSKSRQEADENDKNHVLSERKRREKINERFLILGSLIPSGGKVDKVSILDHTIHYLKELERKVEKLESHKEAMQLESTTLHKPIDAVERTSDNYGSNKIGQNKRPSTSRRNLCNTDKSGSKNKRPRLRDCSTDDVVVQVSDKDVSIESRCPWTENMIMEVMGAVSKLRLDVQTFQSSNVDGVLFMTIEAKCKGLKAPSASVVRQALHKVVSQESKKIGTLKV